MRQISLSWELNLALYSRLPSSPCLQYVFAATDDHENELMLTFAAKGEDLRASSAPAAPNSRIYQLRDTISQPVVAAFWAGGVAGAVSRTVVSPLERLKILFQVQSAGRDAYNLSVGKALAKMWREEGWRGFMRGNGTNCIRIVPYSAVQFGSYNFYKRVSWLTFISSLCAPRQLAWFDARSGRLLMLTFQTRTSLRKILEST